MARLTFKEYLKEDIELLTRPLRMVKLKKDTTDPTGKRVIKDTEAEKEDIGNYPDNVDHLNTLVGKPEPTLDPNQREVIPKPIASGGIGKEIALERARNRATNNHFGPSQFYKIDAKLKGPSVTTIGT